MSRSIHFVSKSISGYGPSDGGCLPCSGVSGRALGITPNSSRGDYKITSDVKFLSLKCASRQNSAVCNATPSNYRRNPDKNYSRQNRNSFSRNRNRHNDDKDGYEDLEESETLSSRNGPILSLSGNQKFQATATPGPREKEIVELFRKVQAQLRERAAMKEEKKVEDPQGKSKESETVDSLLKLLRKHSVQQGKRNTNFSTNKDFILDQPEQVGPGPSTGKSSDTNSSVKHDIQESRSPSPIVSRPKSNFRKRSPVPEIKFQPVNSVSMDNLEQEGDEINGVKIESDVEPVFSEGNVFDDVAEDETSEIYETEHEEQDLVEATDLSGMKLTELRALAKSRKMKGFSKLKKSELVELLSGSSI